MWNVISAGLNLAGGLLGSRDTAGEKRARKKLNQAASEQRHRVTEGDSMAGETRADYRRSRMDYLNRLGGFDPKQYLQDAVAGIGADFQEQFQTAEAGREQGMNRRGFLGSPIGSGRMSRDLNSRLARALSNAAFQTAGLEQGKIDRYGDVGRQDAAMYQFDRGVAENRQGMYLDLLAGNRDAEINRGNSKRAAWSNAFSGAGAALIGGK